MHGELGMVEVNWWSVKTPYYKRVMGIVVGKG